MILNRFVQWLKKIILSELCLYVSSKKLKSLQKEKKIIVIIIFWLNSIYLLTSTPTQKSWSKEKGGHKETITAGRCFERVFAFCCSTFFLYHEEDEEKNKNKKPQSESFNKQGDTDTHTHTPGEVVLNTREDAINLLCFFL